MSIAPADDMLRFTRAKDLIKALASDERQFHDVLLAQIGTLGQRLDRLETIAAALGERAADRDAAVGR
ncbi:MAG: hypothetical protein ACK4MF_09750, partial [Hyphomicrobiaceae bacterium]